MARAMFRIRCIPQPRIVGGQRCIGAFQIQRRVARLFWREIAITAKRDEADLLLSQAARERRVARLRPLLIAKYDAHGKALPR
jgi:hypothetical protein